MRELSSMLKHIDRRIHNKFASQASLHGVKIPYRRDTEQDGSIELSDNEHKSIADAFKQAQLRVTHGIDNSRKARSRR